jgi:hypothetical protein
MLIIRFRFPYLLENDSSGSLSRFRLSWLGEKFDLVVNFYDVFDIFDTQM